MLQSERELLLIFRKLGHFISLLFILICDPHFGTVFFTGIAASHQSTLPYIVIFMRCVMKFYRYIDR
jgi:hypothetical protein